MGLIIYRKSDNKVMMEVIQYPLHDKEIFQKFIANGKYNANDYLSLNIHQDLIPQAMQKKIVIQNGKITFGEERKSNPTEIVPSTPSATEALTDYIIDVDYRVTMIELGL